MTMGDARRHQLFTELFDANHTKVLAYVRRRLDANVANDAVADTFLAAWKNLDRLTGDPLLWLYGLARGVVANHRRALGRAGRLNVRLSLLDPPSTAPDHADIVGWRDPFAAAFRQLSEPEREVLQIVAWEGLTPAEGAVVLGCSTTAFKVRTHRARRRLRHLLDANEVTQAAVTTRPPARSTAPEVGEPLPKEIS
jgi:RNA polymerase sigma-70 factor (ECF subfamily)